MSARVIALVLPLGALLGCAGADPTGPAPETAVPFAAPALYGDWFASTEACAGLTGDLSAVQWYVVPGVDTFPTDQGPKVGMWSRRGDRHVIVLAGNYRSHEMVVRHEMLHALIGHSGHPAEYFAERCHLTWETWDGA